MNHASPLTKDACARSGCLRLPDEAQPRPYAIPQVMRDDVASGSETQPLLAHASSVRLPHRRRAFTIVEVMIALLIFAMMAVVLTASYLNILNAYDRAKTRPKLDLDVRFARNALLTESDFETAQKGAQFDGATGRHVTWTSVIEPTSTANLFLVTFTCELSAGQGPNEPEQTITEVFRLLRPTWSTTSGFSPDAATLRQQARDLITQAQQPSPLSGLGPSTSGGASGGGAGSGKNNSGGGGSGKNTKGGDAKGGGGRGGNTDGGRNNGGNSGGNNSKQNGTPRPSGGGGNTGGGGAPKR